MIAASALTRQLLSGVVKSHRIRIMVYKAEQAGLSANTHITSRTLRMFSAPAGAFLCCLVYSIDDEQFFLFSLDLIEC